jgi:hypothetical protein
VPFTRNAYGFAEDNVASLPNGEHTDASEALIVMVKLADAAVAFVESVAVNTYGPYAPAVVGVPAITPPLVTAANPGGKAPPEVSVQV